MAIATLTAPAVGDPITAAFGGQIVTDVNALLGSTIFMGTQHAAQTIATGTTGVAILIDTESLDFYNGHSTSSNTSQYVVPSAMNGMRLRVQATATFAANATGIRGLQVHKNSTTISLGAMTAAATATNSMQVQAQGSTLVATGDIIEIAVIQTSGGNLAMVADSSGMEIVFAGVQ